MTSPIHLVAPAPPPPPPPPLPVQALENLSIPDARPSGTSMADIILEVIAKADPEPAHSNAVAKAIGCRNKKEINPTLFDMQRKGLLQKVQDSPPLWVLTIAGREIVEARPRGSVCGDGDVERESTAVDAIDSGDLDIDAVNVSIVNTDLPTVGDSKPAPEDHDSKVEAQELAERILFTLLQADNCTSTAVALAKALGFQSKRSVNPCLFKMQSKGLTAKISDCPPVWSLTPSGVEQGRIVSLNPSFVHAGISALKGAALSTSSTPPGALTPPNGFGAALTSFAGSSRDLMISGGGGGGGKPLIDAC